MATEADKYIQTISKKRYDELIDIAKKKISDENIPASKTYTTIKNVILEDKYKQEKIVEEKRKAEWLKKNSQAVQKPDETSKPTTTVSKPTTTVLKPDESPPKLKIEKTVRRYYEEPANDVPLKVLTGVENMSRFKFRADDTPENTFSKINYIKAILKNKTVNQKGEILKYYEFRIKIEKRSGQEYFYASKNIKNTMYRFYIGKVWQK
jgi:hypothetical protein